MSLSDGLFKWGEKRNRATERKNDAKETECEVKEQLDREKNLQIPWNRKTITTKDVTSDKRTECNVLGTE